MGYDQSSRAPERRGRLEGRSAIVTGGSEGIGAAITRAFAAEGAQVLIVARRQAPAAALCEELGAERVHALAADVAEPGTAARAVAVARDAFGGLDVLVNNAGIDLSSTPLLSTTDEQMRAIFDVNFFGAARMLQAAAEAMAGGGSIINITSRVGLVGIPGMTIYGAAKGALQSLTRGAAIELAGKDIRVNAVAPGLTETPLISRWIEAQDDPGEFRAAITAEVPLGRFATPEGVAAAVVYLASDEAAAVTGASISVDGGYTAK